MHKHICTLDKENPNTNLFQSTQDFIPFPSVCTCSLIIEGGMVKELRVYAVIPELILEIFSAEPSSDSVEHREE